jgi:4-amino-4-deoxy-L-arabinose transferase-like glycosyltransferase
MSATRTPTQVSLTTTSAAPPESARPYRSRWERWGLVALLLTTLTVYLWRLDQNGWGNPFYAAAAQAGAMDWKAFFFGSEDWNNLITVDKPPLALWPAALSVKLFGLSSWSILVPQAVIGTVTVWLLFATVRRAFPASVAFTAAVLCATAPVFFLMSRYNNPEPMMGMLVGGGLYCAVRAAQTSSWGWYLLSGAAFGLGFLAKQIQALVPLPAIALALLVFGAGTLGGRIVRLVAASGAMVLAAGWWVALVELTPKSDRPYIGGTTTNSMIELTLNYNGVARLVQFPMSQSGGEPTASEDPAPYDGGLQRLFNGNFAPEIGWLLLTAALSTVIVAVSWRVLESRLQRMLAIIACVGFPLTWLLLSYMGTMVHTYYSYSLVVPMALVIALALRVSWVRRREMIGRLYSVLLIGCSAYMGVRVMQYSDAWSWWGPALVIGLGVVAAMLQLLEFTKAGQGRLARVAVVLTVSALAAGQIATDVFTVGAPVQGTQPLSGPVSSVPNALSRMLKQVRETGQPRWTPHVAFGVPLSDEMKQRISSTDLGATRWAIATYPAQDAALAQLELRQPVLALGGWLGLDPAPTVEEFKVFAEKGEIGFFIDAPAMHETIAGTQAAAIQEWVAANYAGQEIGGSVLYRLDSSNKR